MKTRFLIIIAILLVLLPWISGLEFGINNQVMVDGITISATVVMSITIVFSLVSWFLFSWASKNIKFAGVLLSIITGASLVIPFTQVLGPMTGVIVGVVAGFAAFMLQKKMMPPAKNQSLIIATITIVATYFVLIMIVLVSQTTPLWDAGNGIGAWTGTAEMMEETGFDNILNNNIGFVFFLVIIPSLIITGWVIQDKKKTKTRPLMIITIVVSVSILMYVNFAYPQGDTIDLDPDLSPSYALDFATSTNSIFVVLPMILSIVFLLIIIPHLILKRKKIPSRPYISLIAAAIMLFFGIPSLINGLEIIILLIQEERLHSLDFIANLTAMASIGFILALFGMIILLKSKLIINLLGRIK
ncbi:hypothetical protein [Nitrosopumilus ureiphilus]|uniref:Uncharacterized protein n=1 Tax=Nitrosopumilus ureiphilus TaxID=1470067 RepID=A0A7D5RD87_9ARCH|nr:hypothetical protein [Nitrosopumilus ureiphilus]QLH06143.1 hypothetical protein C5F50_02915 [Nitrosopumilus ureiphilus]